MTVDLIATWEARDARYAKRVLSVGPEGTKRKKEAHQLTPREMECIRWYRLGEADRLPVATRAKAIDVLRSWEPPFAVAPNLATKGS